MIPSTSSFVSITFFDSKIISQFNAWQYVLRRWLTLRSGSFNSRRLVEIVNCIRQNERDFAEWHGSDVARQFAPPVFRNRKQSSGYFF